MENISYQNIDTPQNNPLEAQTPTVSQVEDQKPKSPLNLKDPRMVLLVVLGGILVVLLFAALVVKLIPKKQTSSKVTLPNSEETTQNSPTPAQGIIPSPYVNKFQIIQNQLNQDEDFLPPSIDSTIGK